MSKSFVDSTSDVVLRSLRGTVRFTPNLALDPEEKIVFRRSLQTKSPAKKVILLSGGGSGHEPAHAGFVGEGMLDVAVAGNIFASPSASQIFKAIQAFPSEEGILIIAKNYTGDALHFGLATEKAKAAGIKCKLLIVGDDIAIPHKPGSTVGRRGLAGVALVHKIVGAAAAKGASLDELYVLAESVARNLATIGVSLQKCHVPGRLSCPDDQIGPDELEYGMGIHNEPGVQRASVISLEETVSQLLDRLLGENGSGRTFLTFNKTDVIALAINNLGGLSILELHAILDETMAQLSSTYGLIPRRLIRGTLVSSINGPGFSITLLKLDSEMIPLLDQATEASGWVPVSKLDERVLSPEVKLHSAETTTRLSKIEVDSTKFQAALEEISKKVTIDEPAITHFDTIAGDGDCGQTLLSGSNAISCALKSGEIDTSNLITGLHTISNIVEANMGGTSGAIYGIFLNALVCSLNNANQSSGNTTSAVLAAAGSQALEELFKYTQAREGNRTMMDVLIPFIQHVAKNPDNLKGAFEAAERGMESTKRMKASFGRASYVDERIFEREDDEGGIPDAGALGLLSIFSGLVQAVAS